MVCIIIITHMKIFIVVLLLVYDEHNYFYLNTSYTRNTISFSFCFRFQKSTTITFESAALIPTGDHKTVGVFNGSSSIIFDPPFVHNGVGYNTNDKGQYWFAIKRYQPTQSHFQKISLQIQQQSKSLKYWFLISLFNMPMSAFLIYPINTLYSCGNQLLVSYSYSHPQVDLFLFGQSKQVKKINVLQQKDWGIKIEAGPVRYLRYKSKKSSQVTVTGIESEQSFKCVITAESLPKNQIAFDQSISSYTVADLLKSKAVSLDAEVQAVSAEL